MPYLVRSVERVVHESRDEGRFAHRLLAEEDELELFKRVAEIGVDRRRHRKQLKYESVIRH